MRPWTLLLLLATGCAQANYSFNFELTNPGAKNPTKPGERAVLDDGDVRAELLVDATNFQAVLLVLTNNGPEPLMVMWNHITMVGPDQVAMPMRPDDGLGWVKPGTKVSARLVPFALPTTGGAAMAYDKATYTLVVPVKAAGKHRDLRFVFVAHAARL